MRCGELGAAGGHLTGCRVDGRTVSYTARRPAGLTGRLARTAAGRLRG